MNSGQQDYSLIILNKAHEIFAYLLQQVQKKHAANIIAEDIVITRAPVRHMIPGIWIFDV